MPNVLVQNNASVQWTDGTGAAAIFATVPRFSNWTPDAEDIGPSVVGLGTGLTYKFIERTDYTAAFDITAVPASQMALYMRLKRWMEGGGQVTVNTQDIALDTYICVIKPGSKLSTKFDPVNLEYTMHLEVLNVVDAPLLCVYLGQLGANWTIVVTPTVVVLQAGTGFTAKLVAVVTDNSGNILALPVTWLTSAPAVAKVTQAGLVSAVSAGSCVVYATLGGAVTQVPVTITASVSVGSVNLSPSSLAFTQTTYTGIPQVNVSGVPGQTITAVQVAPGGITIPYAAGSLAWSSSSQFFQVTDNNDGTATVIPLAGALSATITCASLLTGVTSAIAVSSVAGVPAALVPTPSGLVLTAVGQAQAVSVVTIDQYGVIVP